MIKSARKKRDFLHQTMKIFSIKKYLKTLVDEKSSFVGHDDIWSLKERFENDFQNIDEMKRLAILRPEIITFLDDFKIGFQNVEHGHADVLED